MKKPDLMELACKYAKTHPAELFRLACLHTHQNFTKKETLAEYKDQTSTGRWEDWVLDTCLDVLAKRIPLWVTLAEDGEVYIVRPLSHLLPTDKWKNGTSDEWVENDW